MFFLEKGQSMSHHEKFLPVLPNTPTNTVLANKVTQSQLNYILSTNRENVLPTLSFLNNECWTKSEVLGCPRPSLLEMLLVFSEVSFEKQQYIVFVLFSKECGKWSQCVLIVLTSVTVFYFLTKWEGSSCSIRVHLDYTRKTLKHSSAQNTTWIQLPEFQI